MKLHPSWILALVLVFPLSLSGQGQPGYCAFRISVRSPTGTPVKGIGVALTKSSGQIFSTTVTDQRGVASFCDAPEGLVDIEVGGHLCGAVAVRYLKAFWMKTRAISVTYENCSGEGFVPIGGCLLTIRTLDKEGAPLSGVTFSGSDIPPALREQTRISDRFGRIFRFINYGGTMTGRLEKPGYVPMSVTDECKSGERPERERIVILYRE